MDTQKLNPYTQAIFNCMQQFDGQKDPELDEPTSQFLANMIQGRFIQYLVTRMCQHYDITDPELEKRLIMVLMTILSDKFFVVFREKVNADQKIVYKIAKRIVSSESISNSLHRTDALYRWISKKYFEYLNFDIILTWINTNTEVEKIVFMSNVKKRIKDSGLIKALYYIVQNDEDGIAAGVFNRYVIKNKIDRLDNLVKTGDWQIEASYIQDKSAKMIAWRKYMENIQSVN